MIQKVEPEYSPIARAARIQGQIVLTAIMSKTGEIQTLTFGSGQPMLERLRYKPSSSGATGHSC
jgi:hypothetical protein